MDIQLLKHLGNIEQVAGIRESTLLRGPGQGLQIAEFYNAAGLRFSVVPDRCMDLYDFSYKGMNLSFQSKNGLTAPQLCSAASGEFAQQWPAGMLVTCGLDNVGGEASEGGNFPTHGRTSNVPAASFGTDCHWEGDNYILRASGEIHETQLFGRHLSIRRTIETSLQEPVVRIHDTVTNYEAEEEPYMMLYHFNFGYPLLQSDSLVHMTPSKPIPLTEISKDFVHISPPIDGQDEELYLHTQLEGRACAVLYNERLELGAYIAFDTENLPNLLQWKRMKSHDYVVGLEPCNTWGINRDAAAAQKKLAMLPAYSSIENHLELGVLEGLTTIRAFIRNL